MRRRQLLPLILLAAALLAPGLAFAHASLVASDPAEGPVVASGPASVGLVFNEPVAPLVFSLTGADGATHALAGATAADRHVTVPLPSGVGEGTAWLAWRVISADGHPVHGTLRFSIGAATGGVDPAPRNETRLDTGIWLARLLLYSGLFLGVGGIFFRRWQADGPAPQTLERALSACLGLGLAAAIASLGLQGLDALGRPLAALADAAVWRAGWQTSYGLTAAIAFATMALALLFRRNRAATAIAMVGPGLALAASGHAASVEPVALMRALVFVHATAVAYWIGALLPLAALLRTGSGQAPLIRFAATIPPVFAVLVATGTAVAIVQVGRIDALWTTTYGLVLCGKLALFVALAGLALFNRVRLTKPALAGEPGAARRLVRVIAAEIVLALAILAFAAFWRLTVPPRAVEPEPTAIELHLHGETAMAEIEAKLAAGGSTFDITPLDGNGVPFQPIEVTAALTPADNSSGPVALAVTPRPDGSFRAEAPPLGAGRRWKITVDLLVSDFEKVHLSGEVAVPPGP